MVSTAHLYVNVCEHVRASVHAHMGQYVHVLESTYMCEQVRAEQDICFYGPFGLFGQKWQSDISFSCWVMLVMQVSWVCILQLTAGSTSFSLAGRCCNTPLSCKPSGLLSFIFNIRHLKCILKASVLTKRMQSGEMLTVSWKPPINGQILTFFFFFSTSDAIQGTR